MSYSQTVLVPAMINMLTDFADATRFDLSSLEVMAYGDLRCRLKSISALARCYRGLSWFKYTG
jgi:hypothetical protein